MSTLALTDFLLARIAGDEAAAQAATRGPWLSDADTDYATVMRPDRPGFNWDGYSVCVVLEPEEGTYRDNSEHIARHHPERVLAQCEANRRIVTRETERLREQWRRRSDEHRQTFNEWLRPPYGETLRDLASIYADHPDYDEEWKP